MTARAPFQVLGPANFKKRFKLAARTQRWAVTMTKVCIRQLMSAAPFPRWHFVSFTGARGRESRGVVDLIAIRKDHKAYKGLKRGDRFQIILIQVKGGYAANPTVDDADCLRAVARYHRAQCVLLASKKKERRYNFSLYEPNAHRATLIGSKFLTSSRCLIDTAANPRPS